MKTIFALITCGLLAACQGTTNPWSLEAQLPVDAVMKYRTN